MNAAAWFPVVDYGYYFVDQGKLLSVKNSGTADFRAGDKIGIWPRNTVGDVYTSTELSGADWNGNSAVGPDDIFRLHTNNIRDLVSSQI